MEARLENIGKGRDYLEKLGKEFWQMRRFGGGP
jgi:hypothetical protein